MGCGAYTAACLLAVARLALIKGTEPATVRDGSRGVTAPFDLIHRMVRAVSRVRRQLDSGDFMCPPAADARWLGRVQVEKLFLHQQLVDSL